MLEHHLVVVFVERGPAAVLALHGKNPVNGALHRLALVTAVGMLHAAQTEANHRAVIHVRIELVVELEVPAAGLTFFIFDFPVADGAYLLLQNPVGALHHARIIRRHTRLAKSKNRIRRIPHRRHAGLHAEGVFLFDAELLKFIERANHLRIVQGITQAAQRNDGIHHRGINRAQTIAHFEMFQHPFLRAPERDGAQRTHVHTLKPMRHPVEHEKEVAPRNQLLRPMQVHARLRSCRRRIIPRLPFRAESS